MSRMDLLLKPSIMHLEVKAVLKLIQESNPGKLGGSFQQINNNGAGKKCMCMHLSGNSLSPWLTDTEMRSLKQNKLSSTDCIYRDRGNAGKITLSKTKDSRRLTKSNSNDTKDTCLKFYHFDDVCEYMTQYRENITVPVLMQYRTRLSRSICGGSSCHQTDASVKDCNCSKKSPVVDSAWLSVAYVKQIESTLMSRCYCDSAGVSVKAIIEQVKQRSTTNTINDANKLKKSPPRKEYYCKSDGKLKSRQPASPKCLRQTVVLGKKGHSHTAAQRKNQQFLRLKTGCDDVDALRVISATKMKIGPRMGSNYPPSDKKDINRYTPSGIRRNISHTTIPRRKSFQACIIPVPLPNTEVNQ